MVKWIKCPVCGHKLFRLESIQPDGEAEIEIKCSSCKRIIGVVLDGIVDCAFEKAAGDNG